MIDLSVVIVSFNTKDLLLDCVSSVLEHSRAINTEVIIVDNGSTDTSVESVKKGFPGVKIIENKENLGFAAANNQGMKLSSGRYILLLNSDTKILDNALSKMVDWMDENKHASVSTCSLLNKDGSAQPTGGYFPTLPRVLAWCLFLDDLPFWSLLFKPYHPKASFYSISKELDWVTGAFFLMRKEVVNKAGFLDENLFMYAEELEYCYRIKKQDFKVYFTPTVGIIHYGMKSGSLQAALVGEYKGIKYIYGKHFNLISRHILSILLKIGALLRFALMGVLMHNNTLKETYAKCFKVA